MDCIFAPLNNVNLSSIVVLRISGNINKIKECLNVFNVINFDKFLTNKTINTINTKKPIVKLCKLYKANNSLLDEALITLFLAPYSFTGEFVVEISFHASKYIILYAIETLSKINQVRFAKNGEFTYRAFINGKIDLIQSESVNEIIKSNNEFSHNIAFKNYQGSLSNIFKQWKDNLTEVLSLITCYIDFAEDEEITDNFELKINTILTKIKGEMMFYVNQSIKTNDIKDGVKCCIFGPPNSGKSSFLNKISTKDVSIVSDLAGTTRDVIEFSTSVSSLPVIFYDTAGIRETNESIELEGIKRAKITIKQSQMQIFIIDINQLDLFDKFTDYITQNTIIIINKIDLKDGNFQDDNLQDKIKLLQKQYNQNIFCLISIKHSTKWDDFIQTFVDFINKNFIDFLSESFALNERQNSKIKACLSALESLSNIYEIELFSEDLRHCIFLLEEVLGVIDSEDILDKMFSTFCIGK